MPKAKPALPWECSTQSAYVPLAFEGEVVGFCRPDCAMEIARSLNEAELLQKALQLVCYDLVARSGGSSESVDELVKRYLAKAERPLQGAALVAVLLKERQIDLDLTDDEFAKFCDSYRLSRVELKAIYRGEEVESHQLIPLSRILGKTVDEVIEAWKGDE
ncbi:MAG: hypothetical protein MUC48_05390 [Leptolyngbya sp. Prado105]|jgi:hypothetical protein|nr:hypothetical protein [Leptolyngbya sp. Prado105]